jgi:hypothetical protein
VNAFLSPLLRLRWPGPAALTGVGAGLWVATIPWTGFDPFDTRWAKALLMLAPLVLVPLGLHLLREPWETGAPFLLWRAATVLQLPAAGTLAAAFLLPQGPLAGALALPWVLAASLMALLGLLRLKRLGLRQVSAWCPDAALVLILVGSLWALADRLDYHPLDFDPVIVLLTGIHFHYAGFVLPLIAGLTLRRSPGRVARAASLGVLAGVPLVAAGITASQLKFSPLPECFSAWWLSLAVLLVAGLQMRLAVQDGGAVGVLWATSSLCLVGTMALAALYGSRFYLPEAWLEAVAEPDRIPWMRALHGTANALGFALLGLLGWVRAGR